MICCCRFLGTLKCTTSWWTLLTRTSCARCSCQLAVYAFANVSGAHLNPAVSFALMCTGHMKWWKGLLYMIMQVCASAASTQLCSTIRLVPSAMIALNAAR